MAQCSKLIHDIDLRALQQFTLKRQKDDGGFGATPMLPHTITDTYCAVEILAIIQRETAGSVCSDILAQRATREYLAGFAARSDAVSARIRFQLTALLHRFALTPEVLPRVARKQKDFRNYEELFYLVQAGKDTAAARSTAPDFRVMENKNVKECFFYLNIQDPADYTTALQEWLASSQGGDGGFGFFPGTTSFIENCDYALAALALINGQPEDAGKAARFIRYCQTGAGGFARSPSAAPFLESSLHGLRALQALEQITGQSS